MRTLCLLPLALLSLHVVGVLVGLVQRYSVYLGSVSVVPLELTLAR